MLFEMSGVDVFYGKLQVLRDVSVCVNHGEVVALLGANGAGKTTTLRTISGLIRPSKGSLRFKGKDLKFVPAHQIVAEGISHVPEGRRIFGDSSVRTNLEMGAYTSRKRKDLEDRMEAMFDLFPVLKRRMDQPGGTLSGGEQQMLAIARGLINDPELLLLDEPSLGLAPMIVKQMFGVVSGIKARGIAVFIVEQNVRHSLETSDRAYVLQNGKIVMNDSAAELLENTQIKKAYLGL